MGGKEIEAQFNVGRPPNVRPGDPQTLNVVVNLDHQAFEAAGSYSVILEVDGEIAARRHFTLNLANNFAILA